MSDALALLHSLRQGIQGARRGAVEDRVVAFDAAFDAENVIQFMSDVDGRLERIETAVRNELELNAEVERIRKNLQDELDKSPRCDV